jgi:glycosyltransferase involved in cell wall biosynthesis
VSNYLVAVDHHEHDRRGGSFHIAWSLARLLRDQGHHVSMLCAAPDAQPRLTTMIEGVRVARYNLPPTLRFDPRRLARHIETARAYARAELGDRRYDVMHLHSLASGIGAFRAFGTSAEVVVTVHSPVVEEQRATLRGSLVGRVTFEAVRRIVAPYEDEFLRAATTVHVLSSFTATLLARDHGDDVTHKIVHVPWWCEHRRQIARGDAKRALGVSPNVPVLFTVRRLVRRTGVDVFLRALASMATQTPFQVFIAGDGPEAPMLAQLAAQLTHVHLLGTISDEHKTLLFQAADMFVLPTRELECFGLVTLDALSVGCPVIGTNSGATPELLGDLLSDLLVPAGSAPALAGKLTDFIEGRLRVPSEDAIAQHAHRTYPRRKVERAFVELLTPVATGAA